MENKIAIVQTFWKMISIGLFCCLGPVFIGGCRLIFRKIHIEGHELLTNALQYIALAVSAALFMFASAFIVAEWLYG